VTDRAPHVVVLCTGNAARSVMAGAMLAAKAPHVQVTTAGTHVIEGQPMSVRTRDAMAGLGFEDKTHRSTQITAAELASADIVVAMAREHVLWMRRQHPEAAGKTATIKRLIRDLPGTDGALHDRLAELGLANVELEEWEDVEDPAGGHAEVFHACARELLELVEEFATHLPAGS
jgi:protein-tyrosine-phosphatase